MLNWKRLHLYEEFFYSPEKTVDESCEQLREAGNDTVYFRCNLGKKSLPKGMYVFLQMRTPVDETFLEEHQNDLAGFLLHKNVVRSSEKIYFRTLIEDGATAYQIWIPIQNKTL